MDFRVGIELVDQLQQLCFAGTGRQVVIECLDTHFLGRTALVAHVHGRRGVAAHQHHGQARARAPGSQAGIHAHLQVVEEFLGDTAAIKDAGGLRGGLGWDSHGVWGECGGGYCP
ncbi:hypothetical protein D9M71_762440 [compost metagenome]